MKRAALLLIVSSSLALACVQGEIEGGAPGITGAGGLPILTGAAGSAPSGAAGGGGTGGTTAVVAGGAGVTGAAGTGTASTSGSGAGAAGTGAAGAGAAGTGAAGAGAAGTGAAAGAQGAGVASCNPSGIPGDVAAVISATCVACHGNTPIQGVPSAMTTYAQLTAPAVTDPTKSVAAVALARMQSTDMTKQMPPPRSRARPPRRSRRFRRGSRRARRRPRARMEASRRRPTAGPCLTLEASSIRSPPRRCARARRCGRGTTAARIR